MKLIIAMMRATAYLGVCTIGVLTLIQATINLDWVTFFFSTLLFGFILMAAVTIEEI